MPRYDYRCTSCSTVFEEVQSFHSEPGADCPKCGSPSERQMSIPTVIYKGSGFYTTDYARSGSSNGSSSGNSSSSSSDSNGSSDSGSSGSAPEKKSSDTKADSSASSGSASGGGHGHSHGPDTHTH